MMSDELIKDALKNADKRIKALRQGDTQADKLREAVADVAMSECPSCGKNTTQETDGIYCTNCGKKFATNAPADTLKIDTDEPAPSQCQCTACVKRRDALARPVETVWEVWTYDVWGNANDGYEVNDRYCQTRTHELALVGTLNNKGHELESVTYAPTDEQVRDTFEQYFGLGNTKITIDGDDMTIVVRREHDDYPIGEMCIANMRALPMVYTRQSSKQAD